MPSTETIAVLNCVLGIVLRSFPQYLRWSRPWVPPGHERQLEALEKIVTAQDALAERIFEAVGDLGGRPDTGEFPMEFTDTHDLSIDYILREAVGYGRQDVVELEAAAATPNLLPQAQLLVTEAVNTAKQQLASLEALVPANLAV
jgi:bacterioferritin (cytochrome b1)